MPETIGAAARQKSRTLQTLASSIEPEGIIALAAVALELLEAINAGRLVATDPATRALIEATYPLQDAIHGSADQIPGALAAFLVGAESGVFRG